MTNTQLIAIADIKAQCPWWPYSVDGTYRLIRLGQLRAVAVGRRRFVTPDLLSDFVQRHVTEAA